MFDKLLDIIKNAKNFFFFCLNHLIIHWHIWKNRKNPELDPPTPLEGPQNPLFWVANLGKFQVFFNENYSCEVNFWSSKTRLVPKCSEKHPLSYPGTRNILGEGQKLSKFEILGHFPKIPGPEGGKTPHYFLIFRIWLVLPKSPDNTLKYM